MTNELVDGIGKLAQQHPQATSVANGVTAAGLAAVGGVGIYSLIRGGLAGKRVLSGLGLRGILGNLGNTSLGIAEGKAVQAATGVQSVFIVNWPAGFGPASAVTGGITAAGGRSLFTGAVAGAGLIGTVVAAPFVSKMIGDVSKENGWGSQTWSHNSREYEVMGISRQLKNDIKIDLQIDGNGRVFSSADGMNTSVSTKRRGNFFENMLVSH